MAGEIYFDAPGPHDHLDVPREPTEAELLQKEIARARERNKRLGVRTSPGHSLTAEPTEAELARARTEAALRRQMDEQRARLWEAQRPEREYREALAAVVAAEAKEAALAADIEAARTRARYAARGKPAPGSF